MTVSQTVYIENIIGLNENSKHKSALEIKSGEAKRFQWTEYNGGLNINQRIFSIAHYRANSNAVRFLR